jgi:hypothetical protein
LQCNGSAQAGVAAGFRAGRGPRLGRTVALLGRAGMPNNIPVALMSSSMSGQCTPNPLPMNSKFPRCSGVASDKRHDQAKGTLMTRPSARCATIESSVICISMMRGVSLTTVFIPLELYAGNRTDVNRRAPRGATSILGDGAPGRDLTLAEEGGRRHGDGETRREGELRARDVPPCPRVGPVGELGPLGTERHGDRGTGRRGDADWPRSEVLHYCTRIRGVRRPLPALREGCVAQSPDQRCNSATLQRSDASHPLPGPRRGDDGPVLLHRGL